MMQKLGRFHYICSRASTAALIFVILHIFGAFYLHAETINLATLGNNLHNINKLSGSFEQENVDHIQARRTKASGQFFFLKPGLMKWIYDKPDPYSIIVGNRSIWIHDPVLESVTIHSTTKIKGLTLLSMLFAPKQLKSHFKTVVPKKNLLDNNTGHQLLFLTFKQPDPVISEVQIAFDNHHLIKQFVVLERNQNYRKISFSDVDRNPQIDALDFEFQIPEGLEIIDKTTENP